MEEIKKVQLKGTAYPVNEYFWKKAHPRQWKIRQLLKKFVRFISFGYATIHYTYPKAKINIK